MKTLILGLCLFGATAAFGQLASAISNEPQIIQIPSHPGHASQKSLAEEQTLLITSNPIQAHGERPLWEVVQAPRPEVPLGDTARLFRSQHTAEKKAKVYWHD
jgi:hypothetical protein